ncbi:hypothetical protein KQX54_021362 [Cotesia glomerata]|uniref:Uncharacterized protein n=1 Tax=Cotesia glomerata TaxID=32391 RepID=A0AAV7JAG0_COTGL|nr:hypothetical protein KQX54_021362 [Cotesia glomerata]
MEILIHLHKVFAFLDVGKNMRAFLNRCVRAWVKSELRYKRTFTTANTRDIGDVPTPMLQNVIVRAHPGSLLRSRYSL